MKSRIKHLPRRDWRPTAVSDAEYLTEVLRIPGGSESLKPVQGAALAEHAVLRGWVGYLPVGVGKGHLAVLAHSVIDCERPAIFCPGSLVRDMKERVQHCRRHWQVHPNLKVHSYELLANIKNDTLLDETKPDSISLDEMLELANFRSKRVRKLNRYIGGSIEAGAKVPVFAMSGTWTDDEFTQYSHVVVMALHRGAPLPLRRDDQCSWQQAFVDQNWAMLRRDLGKINTETQAWDALYRRLDSAPGLMLAGGSAFDGVPLTVEQVAVEPAAPVIEAFDKLRQFNEYPDGEPLVPDEMEGSGFEEYHAACKLSLGFYYVPIDPPPLPWLKARRAIGSLCRKLVEADNQPYDSIGEVFRAHREKKLHSAAFDNWIAIKDTYDRKVRPEWFDFSAIEQAVMWGEASGRGSIIWTSYIAFGETLSEVTGWPYFRERARDAKGRYAGTLRSTRDPVVILSLDSCHRGLNLQGADGYWKSLYTSPPIKHSEWEQSLGRGHREGAVRPNSACVWARCYETMGCLRQAIFSADWGLGTLKAISKLHQAQIITPESYPQNSVFDKEAKSETQNQIRRTRAQSTLYL